jgi:hypothetical protein
MDKVADSDKLLMAVSIVSSPQAPADAVSLVQQACASAALDIIAMSGAKVWASAWVPAISALGPWADGHIISIKMGFAEPNQDSAQIEVNPPPHLSADDVTVTFRDA